MKEKPIIFNGDMVRAILDGRKTQTRRIVADTEQALNVEYIAPWAKISYQLIDNSSNLANKTLSVQCPHGRVGDQMWVRETFSNVGESYKRYANLMNRKIETIPIVI
ncbi:hypothetical protein ID858_18515, partial [Xenorhabdus sp. DI]|nr:hypothetical protein [Xenorhabdus sp. 3]MBD2790476.1 hypothetical protein [Xenorhabdus sp. DI]